MANYEIVPGKGKVKVSNDIGCMRTYSGSRDTATPRQSMYERTRAQVYATGNRWAIENFHATHD